MSRTYGSYMIQPTKDTIRGWLSEARTELKTERLRNRILNYKLEAATRKLGELVLEGKIAIPVEKLGEIVLETAIEEQREIEAEAEQV